MVENNYEFRQSSFNGNSGHCRQHIAAIIECLLPLMFGTAIGWPSPIMGQLQSADSPIGETLSSKEAALVATLTFFGGFIGTLLWAKLSNILSRKISGYAIATLFLINWAIIEFSWNKYALYAARFLLGIAGPGTVIISPVFISEFAEDKIRGTLGTYPIFFMNIGTLTSYTFGALTSYRVLTAVCLVIPFIYICLFVWLPEAPMYLWCKGDFKSAETSLKWYRGNNLQKVEDDLKKFTEIKVNTNTGKYSMLFHPKGNRNGFLIGVAIFGFQQFSGILVLLTYTSIIFKQSGSWINSDLATILVGIFQLIPSGFSALLVDKTGRKILLLISFFSMVIVLTALGVFFYLKDCTEINTSNFAWLPVVLLCSYMVVYSLGVGPLPYLVVSEVLTPEIKALAFSIIAFWSLLLTTGCVQLFPYMVPIIGNYGVFWFFAVFCFLGFLHTLFLIPETKGKPFTEILEKLNA